MNGHYAVTRFFWTLQNYDILLTVHLSIIYSLFPTWYTDSFISSNLIHNSYINSTKLNAFNFVEFI